MKVSRLLGIAASCLLAASFAYADDMSSPMGAGTDNSNIGVTPPNNSDNMGMPSDNSSSNNSSSSMSNGSPSDDMSADTATGDDDY